MGTGVVAEPMRCPNCDNTIIKDNEYCPFCGINFEEMRTETFENRLRWSSYLSSIGGIILLLNFLGNLFTLLLTWNIVYQEMLPWIFSLAIMQIISIASIFIGALMIKIRESSSIKMGDGVIILGSIVGLISSNYFIFPLFGIIGSIISICGSLFSITTRKYG